MHADLCVNLGEERISVFRFTEDEKLAYTGKLAADVEDLKRLVAAYPTGLVKERPEG